MLPFRLFDSKSWTISVQAAMTRRVSVTLTGLQVEKSVGESAQVDANDLRLFEIRVEESITGLESEGFGVVGLISIRISNKSFVALIGSGQARFRTGKCPLNAFADPE